MRIMAKLRSNKGFTLLELLIYIFILTIVTMMLANAIISLIGGISQVTASNEVDSSIRFLEDRVGQDVNFATNISVPSGTGSSNSTSTLTITASSGSTVTYCLISSVIYRSTGTCSASSEPMTSGEVKVTALTFTVYADTNNILSKTTTSVQMLVTMSYNSASLNTTYSESDHITFQPNF